MIKRREVAQIASRSSSSYNRNIRRQLRNDFPIIVKTDLKMSKEVEKEIILDAVREYILSCDAVEARGFIREVTDIIVDSCVNVMN
jgi:hypothetical protein